ncbi:MAG: DoxX family membrane protein [Ignavibacterium sp.]|nr:MAG: DoxX family membrane protein [Ignavibacterium sp.]
MLKSLNNKYLLLLLRVVLGIIFIYAAIEKISDPAGFSNSINNYKLLPLSLVNIAAITLPWIELSSGLLLLFGIYVKENSAIIAVLLIVFFVVIAISLARGLDIDCGCFGTSNGAKVSLIKLGENIVMIVMGYLLMRFGSELFSLKEKSES